MLGTHAPSECPALPVDVARYLATSFALARALPAQSATVLITHRITQTHYYKLAVPSYYVTAKVTIIAGEYAPKIGIPTPR